MVKICSKCKCEKTFSDFFKNKRSKDGLTYQCKSCYAQKHKAWRENNNRKEYYKNYDRKLRPKRTEEQLERKRFRDTLTRFNLSEAEYIEIKNKAKGTCGICNKRTKLVIDHCHKSNKVREMICHNCNIVLGHAKDNVNILINCIGYLKRHEV